MKYLFLSIVALVAVSANAQKLSLAGENYLVLNGERFKQQKLNFSEASGDWYSTSKDGHGTLEFGAPYDGRNLMMEIEWDGGTGPHVVTNEIRHDGKRTGEFIITMGDKTTYGDGLNAYPSENDEIKISIAKIDDMNVTGMIDGFITQGRDKVKVSGTFNLKKTTTKKQISNSSYHDCDNVVHDKLIGAEARSPSECEAKYDLDVRTTIHDAVANAIEKLQKEGWEVQDQTKLDPLFDVARGSEKDIFSTDYDLGLQVSTNSPVYKRNVEEYNEISEKMKSGSKEAYEEFVNFSKKMQGETKMEIGFRVNTHDVGFVNFKAGTKVSKMSNSLIKIESGSVQPRTGGGPDDSRTATYLLIGNWKQPTIKKEEDGSENVRSNAVLNPTASHLQAQNIYIRMECSSSLADQFINYLDIQKLLSLINH